VVELCCQDNTVNRTECRSDRGVDAHFECTGPSDCPAGTVCCGQLADPDPYVDVRCQSACSGPMQRVFCASDLDCTAPATCRPSTLLPGRTACRGPGQ
jgi:hypothetical protein